MRSHGPTPTSTPETDPAVKLRPCLIVGHSGMDAGWGLRGQGEDLGLGDAGVDLRAGGVCPGADNGLQRGGGQANAGGSGDRPSRDGSCAGHVRPHDRQGRSPGRST